MFNKYLKKISSKIKTLISSFIPDETIESSKKKWNKLATENAMYHVVSRKGKEIDEEQFKHTGLLNYKEHIEEDELLKSKLGNFSNKKILNIGCGVGRLEEFMSKDFEEVYGVDISEVMVEQSRKRLSDKKNVKFFATDGVSLPFEDGFFDLIFSYIVFQHMPNKDVVESNFKEISRTLKEDAIAKIQIRGGHQPYKWQWFYGPVFSYKNIKEVLDRSNLNLIKHEGEHTKRFWVWVEKKKTRV